MVDILKHVVKHCAPTLAGMKTAGLFGYSFTRELDMTNSIDTANEVLNSKGIFVEVLRVKKNNALVYVYRKSMLCKDLGKKNIKKFLKANGYQHTDVDECVKTLKGRISKNQDFPHEIGLFLGYPFHDVIGFILHGGKNSKATGYWKVYDMEAEALKLFAKFNKCKEIYQKLFSQGRPIERLIVDGCKA